MYSDKYTLANDPESNCKNARSKREPFTEDQLLNITITSLLMGLVIFAIVLVYVTGRSVVIPSNLHLSEQVRKSWAHYSPYTPAGTYAVPSEGCAVKQVNILQRDGARYPNPELSKHIQSALRKLQTVKEYKDPNLNFVANYTYQLGEDDLVKHGAAQSFAAGREAFKRYQRLVSNDTLAFVRASGSPQIVYSATNWTSGFATASDSQDVPAPPFIIPETGNNTLGNKGCPLADPSQPWKHEWLSASATPIAVRLNAAAPGADLTLDDVYSLMAMCALDTVANESASPFCKLFSEEDFNVFEYAEDLNEYYSVGYGHPLGRIRGVGYVNELIARLRHKSVTDHTRTNVSLDASPSTFPNDRSIYADFTSDTQMISIFSALGLFNQSHPLNRTNADSDRTWVTSDIIPFSARMVTERVECDDHIFVRIFVNDALQPLNFCGAGADGLCPLEAFVASQGYSRNDGHGDLHKCFA